MAIRIPAFRPEAALGFNHLKSVQIIAYFIRKSQSESMHKLKLVKLLYLAERTSLERRGKPINFDAYVSLEHGPIVSSALNGMDHKLDDPAWEALSLADNKRDVAITGDVSQDQLSRADKAILDAIWEQFGGMTASRLRNWTHRNIPEYVEVEHGTSLPIDLAEILERVGNPKPADTAHDVRILQREMSALQKLRAA